jgi:hypothetical protein
MKNGTAPVIRNRLQYLALDRCNQRLPTNALRLDGIPWLDAIP